MIFLDQIPQITVNGVQANDIAGEEVGEKEEDQIDGKQNSTINESINDPSETDPEQNM